MRPDSTSEHAPQPDGEAHDDPSDATKAAGTVVPADGSREPDLSSLPEVIGLEVTRILDAARIAGEQIRLQATKEAQEARSKAVQAQDEAARAHEEARLAREDADRAREEAGSMRSRITRLQAQFTGLLREMEPLSEPAPPPTETAPRPTETAESVTAGLSTIKPSTWSPAWGIAEAEGDGGAAAHAGEPGPDGLDGHEEPTDKGSTVVVPEAGDSGQTKGDGPGGPPGSLKADEGAGETPPTGDPTEDADEEVPVLERLRRLATS